MADLKYHGDPGKWELDFTARCREVYASLSGATIEHFMMQAAFKSMAQLSHDHVQALLVMANDMNTTGVIGTGMNLEAIAKKYTNDVPRHHVGRQEQPQSNSQCEKS